MTGPHLTPESQAVISRLRQLRTVDAPTHGGRVLSYVYDSGMAELDALAGAAAELARPLNGLDPTTFPSIAAMERDLLSFVREATHGNTGRGGGRVTGSVTSGGTESCLLAVKTARDLWRSANPELAAKLGRAGRLPRLVLPTTAHAAFRKAAKLFDLALDLVPCNPAGEVCADTIIDRLAADVALVVVSAPAYPSGAVDPIPEVAAAAKRHGISCHVDACFGGLVLPWWQGAPVWDFRNPGVTSISADLHKFGYAPKGVSVLLHRGKARHRKQFFAITKWPSYPVVNPTLLGSRSAAATAAAWAIVQRLGAAGFSELTGQCQSAAAEIIELVNSVPGLCVQGSPVGPALAVVADTAVPESGRVDPHLLADEMLRYGIKMQHQPGLLQADGVYLPHSTHMTVTPVTAGLLPELRTLLPRAADSVRGKPRPSMRAAAVGLRLLGYSANRVPGPGAAWRLLKLAGAAPRQDGKGSLPGRMAPLIALVEELPGPVGEALLTELLARLTEPA